MTKKKQTEKKEKIIFKSFIGCLLAILLVASSYYAYDKIFNYETKITIERIDFNYIGWKDIYDIKAEILCENTYNDGSRRGIEVINWGILGKQSIYSWTEQPSTCLIKTKERVRK